MGATKIRSRRKYSPRRTRAERREQLLDAALRVIDAHGFGGVSIEAVAREAGLTKTVVYDTFGDGPSMLAALLEREQQRMMAVVAAAMPQAPFDDDPVTVLVDGMTAVLETVRKHPETWRLILLPVEGVPLAVRKTADYHRKQILEQVEPIVAWGLGEIGAPELDAELATHLLIAAAEQAARLTLAQPEQFPPQRMGEFTATLIGMLTRAS